MGLQFIDTSTKEHSDTFLYQNLTDKNRFIILLIYCTQYTVFELRYKKKNIYIYIYIYIYITNVTVISPPKHSAAICAGSNGFTSASLNRNH